MSQKLQDAGPGNHREDDTERRPYKAEVQVGVGYIFRGRRKAKLGRLPGRGERNHGWRSWVVGGQLGWGEDRVNLGGLGGEACSLPTAGYSRPGWLFREGWGGL